MCQSFSHVQLFATPWTVVLPAPPPGKKTGVGCHSLLQGIFPTQELKLDLLHFRQILYHLSCQGSCGNKWPQLSVSYTTTSKSCFTFKLYLHHRLVLALLLISFIPGPGLKEQPLLTSQGCAILFFSFFS